MFEQVLIMKREISFSSLSGLKRLSEKPTQLKLRIVKKSLVLKQKYD